MKSPDSADVQELARRAEIVVRHVVEQSEPDLMFQFQAVSPAICDLQGDEAHEAVRTAEQLGWLDGELSEDFGGSWLWTRVHATALGLRQVEAWPPEGREYVPGPWDGDHWGRHAKPCLEKLRDDPDWGRYPASFGMGAVGEDHRNWLALRALAVADYVDARIESSSVSGAVLTVKGRQALNPPPTGVAAVRVQLARGDITRALIDLVEGVVSDHCTALAAETSIDMTDKNGKPLHKLRQQIDRLEAHGGLDQVEAATFRIALDVRNDISHSVTADIDHGRDLVGWLIDGVELAITVDV